MLLVVVTFAALYATLRYSGLWGETDTYARTADVLVVLDQGRLAPADSAVYPNGYGFQAIAVFLASNSGLSIADLQIFGSALLAVWIVVPAWLAYRELTGSTYGAMLATGFLFVQPEFLFVVMRGTHEKFTRGLMLICIFVLARGLRSGTRPALVIGLLLSFHAALFAIVTMNNLLANSFIGAFGIAAVFVGAALLLRVAPQRPTLQILEQLVMIAIAGLLMVFLVLFYAYTPSQYSLQFLKDTGNQTAAAVQATTETVNPYAQINTGWVSRKAYLAVSLANWVLLAVSAAIWMWRSWTWLRRRWQPRPYELLLWSLYSSFTVQSLLSIVVDSSGAIAGTLQHRIFPSFVMLAAPLVAIWLGDWRRSAMGGNLLIRRLLPVVLGVLAMLSLLKATNEPLVSNKWLFYIPAERRALDWAEQSLTSRTVWTEFDERMITAMATRSEFAPRHVQLDGFDPGIFTRDFLLSNVTRARAARLGAPLPVEADSLITYDNGQAQIYHLRPRTPYQR